MQVLPTLTYRQRTGLAFKLKVPGTTVGLLGAPSKMPGFSFGLPAGPACPYIVKDEGSICNGCYARKSHYTATTVVNAQATRFRWVRECLKTEEGTDTFVTTMVETIRQTVTEYFRIHDAGDFFSPAYVRAWIRICQALPEVRFWAPTRSYRAKWLDVIRELAALPNVAVRPSALHFEEAPPEIAGLAAGTGASKTSYTCPAHAQNNECGDCRVCWDNPETSVMYRSH